jgi:lipoprotein-anchoring transpeptidase ErfK/SrfK
MKLPKNQRGYSPIVLILVAALCLSLVFGIIATFNKFSNRSGKYDSSQKTAYFNGEKIEVPKEVITPITDVLGSKSSSKDKRIEINLTDQKLYAYEGSKKKMSFAVSTGKWNLTPTGEFNIWTKLKYTLMTGGSKELGTYYYLPNVPYTMYFYEDYGIHGAYWHDNFGHPMSHGCVNMKPAEAEKLFYWANPILPSNVNSVLSSTSNKGTKVVIYGTTPRE